MVGVGIAQAVVHWSTLLMTEESCSDAGQRQDVILGCKVFRPAARSQQPPAQFVAGTSHRVTTAGS